MRTQAGVSQRDLAGWLRRHQSFVSKYESGERRIDMVEMYDICRALGVSLPALARRLEGQLKLPV